MRSYELLIILDSEIPEEEIDNHIDRLKDLITKKGCEIKDTNKWGKRRLAYEIKKSKKGFYLLLEFAAEPQVISELERDLKFVDGIERFMTVVRSDKAIGPEAKAELEFSEEAV